MHKFIAPAALIFLCGIGAGLSLFPYVMPQTSPALPTQTQAAAVEYNDTAVTQHSDAIVVPELPKQMPLTTTDQEAYVLQLFSPTSSEVSEMQIESEQMKLLEQTMMISFLLSNCGQMKKEDYDNTYIAIVKYLTNNGDPNPRATAREAANRAQASYRMVYRHVPCDDPSLYQMSQSLAEWRNSVSAQTAGQ